MNWSGEGQAWILRTDQLLTDLFGPDYCEYEYTKSKHCVLVPGLFPLARYDHAEWENTIKDGSTHDSKPGNKPDCQTASTPVNTPDCKPSSTLDSNSSSNFNSNPDCRPSSNLDSNPDSKSSSSFDNNPVCKPSSNASHEPTDNPGPKLGNNCDSCKPCCNLACNPECKPTSGHGHKPERVKMKDERVTPANAEDKTGCQKSLQMKQECLPAGFRFDRTNHLTRGERASLKVPLVAFLSSNDFELVESDSKVSDPALVNMWPSESAVKDAMDVLTSSKKQRLKER